MIAYVDSSVVLRVLLREPLVLPEWRSITVALTSSLLRVESYRTFDRYVHNRELTEEQYATNAAGLDELLRRARIIDVDKSLLLAASRRLPVRLATLDAIHLVTAERFRNELGPARPFVFATHDRELAIAARASGFEVIGAPLESGA
ncbi:MAG TPA: type II toxin-antitoxin system VapC family toxin [Thermoanaerobaculia bacterium]|nr:type II toxin-antitoxin system VapC family toxin [Thermoanaerobaculia bacterium]